MEKLSVKRAVTLSCLFIFASLLVRSVSAQTCSGNGTLSGSYRFIATGIGCTTNAQQPHPCPVFPLASVGIITFDGSGNLSGSDVHNVTGLSCNRTFTGSYTVVSDCTGTRFPLPLTEAAPSLRSLQGWVTTVPNIWELSIPKSRHAGAVEFPHSLNH